MRSKTPDRRVSAARGPRVVSARFVTSAPDPAALPPPDLPEMAFCGRSNAGKSSLLGALIGRPKLVRTSRTPGCTTLLNVFEADVLGPAGARRAVRLVDLPGYGYAALPAGARAALARRIETYLATRAPRAVFVLADARHGLGRGDLAFVARAADAGHRLVLVATKADKLRPSQRAGRRRAVAEALGVSAGAVFMTSARTREGIAGPDGLVGLLWDLADPASEAVEVEVGHTP